MATVQDQPPDDPTISGDAKILRRVVPGRFSRRTGQPEDNTFRRKPTEPGLSVTLWLSADDLANTLGPHPGFGVVALFVAEARAEHLRIAFTEEPGNPNHCELFGDLPGSKRQRLANLARWVVYPDGYPEQMKRPTWTLEAL